MKTMSTKDLLNACRNHNYIVVRHICGQVFAFNCRATDLSYKKQGSPPMDIPTNYLSFYPCDFNEYITKKLPFIA